MKKKTFKDLLTIVFISHKSQNIIKKKISFIPSNIKIIIADNSNNTAAKKKIYNRKNLKILLIKNNGYGASINIASRYVKTKYFLVLNPDVEVSFLSIKKLTDISSGIKKNSCARVLDF